jgi:predicted chitinase
VMPKKEAGGGRFTGQIWIESNGFNIVRFNLNYAHKERPERWFRSADDDGV